MRMTNPQGMACSLHYVFQLRGGGSAWASSGNSGDLDGSSVVDSWLGEEAANSNLAGRCASSLQTGCIRFVVPGIAARRGGREDAVLGDGGPPRARSAHDLVMVCDGGNGDGSASAAVVARGAGYEDVEGNVNWALVYVQSGDVERNMRLLGPPEEPGNTQPPSIAFIITIPLRSPLGMHAWHLALNVLSALMLISLGVLVGWLKNVV